MANKHVIAVLSTLAAFSFSAPSVTYAAAPNYLYTSPLYADSGQTYFACNISNVTTAAVVFYAKIIKYDGTNLTTLGANMTLAPGTSYELSAGSYSGFARCQFTINGDTASVRANETVFFYNSNHYEAVSFSEAR